MAKKGLSINSFEAQSVETEFDVNGVNLRHLNKIAVMKKEDQEISAVTKFDSLRLARVTIQGRLNGIKVPEELILVNTAEAIHGKTVINTSMTIINNLTIHGRIDGVLLSSVHLHVVNLHSNDTIFSEVDFKEKSYIIGDMLVKNTTNSIPMDGIVVASEDNVIENKVTFKSHLVVYGGIRVRHKINNIVVSVFDDVLNAYETSTVPVMVFDSAVIFPSLHVRTSVNNISLSELHGRSQKKFEDIHDGLSISIIEVYETGLEVQRLKEQEMSTVSMFAYFELLQKLDMGKTVKFFPIASDGDKGEDDHVVVSNLVVWIDKCKPREPCCRIHSAEMRVIDDYDDDKVIVWKKHKTSIFQYKFTHAFNGIVGFDLFANDLMIGCKTDKMDDEVILKTNYANNSHIYDTLGLSGGLIVDVKWLNIKEMLLMVVGYSHAGLKSGISVFAYDKKDNEWVQLQHIQCERPTSFDLLDDANDIYLAVGFDCGEHSSVEVYYWDADDLNFHNFANISAPPVDAILWVENREDLFLLFANEKSDAQKGNSLDTIYTDPIQVFRYADDLLFNQTIDVTGIYALHTFKLSGETYVLAVCRFRQSIYVIQWKGYGGFQVIQEIPAPGVHSAHTFTTASGNLLLAIASTTGHTSILRAVVRGI